MAHADKVPRQEKIRPPGGIDVIHERASLPVAQHAGNLDGLKLTLAQHQIDESGAVQPAEVLPVAVIVAGNLIRVKAHQNLFLIRAAVIIRHSEGPRGPHQAVGHGLVVHKEGAGFLQHGQGVIQPRLLLHAVKGEEGKLPSGGEPEQKGARSVLHLYTFALFIEQAGKPEPAFRKAVLYPPGHRGGNIPDDPAFLNRPWGGVIAAAGKGIGQAGAFHAGHGHAQGCKLKIKPGRGNKLLQRPPAARRI